MLLAPATRFGPYEVLSLLGTGGMGEVYRARDPRLSREVAIKVLAPELVGGADALRRFEQEARAASALNHASIVTIHEVGEVDGQPYIAMELVEGRSLRELLAGGALPLKRALDVGAKITAGLARAHEAGIVHRDLKPENVIVGKDGSVKLLDFGLAKLSGSGAGLGNARLTRSGVLVGTPAYMSPEQARGEPVDFRSDQFSFGLVLFELLTGMPAYWRETAVQTMSAIIQEDPPLLGEVAPQVPPPVCWLVERCLSKEPDGRYASTRDLAAELATLAARMTGSLRPQGSSSTTGAPRRHVTARAAAAGAAIGLAIGAVAALVLSRAPERPVPSLLPLTHSGADSSPAASPDGRLVAFTSARDGTPRIWLKNLEGGAEAPLTAGPDDFPRFSPDAAEILFVRREGARPALFRVAAVGGEPRRLLDDVAAADFSPDGRQIAFVRWIDGEKGTRESRIGIVDADGGNARVVATVRDRSVLHPRFSRDGRRVAFLQSALSDLAGALSTLDLATGRIQPLVPPVPGAHLSSAAWSGSSVVYARSGSESPYVVNTNTAARVLIQEAGATRAKTLLFSPAFGPVLDIAGSGRLVLEARSERASLQELPLSPGASRWLTHGSSNDRQPAYSRSGDSILFSSNRAGNWDLWTVSTATGSVRNLTDNRADDWDPAFVGDGGRIVWSSNRSGHFEIFIARADGSEARRLSDDGADAENPTATPDGRTIVYSSSNPEKAGLWRIRDDGSGARRIVSGRAYLPEVSPDGTYVLWVSNTGDVLPPIRVARVADGTIVPFEIGVEEPGSEVRAVGRARWSPDGKAILFVGASHDGEALYSQEFRPGAVTTATRRKLVFFDSGADVDTFGVSADGTRVTVGSVERLSNLTIAEGLPGVEPSVAQRRR